MKTIAAVAKRGDCRLDTAFAGLAISGPSK